MQIDRQTIAQLLHLGGQYFLPAASLLRALYSGIRGKFPQGFLQIAFGSIVAGLTAIVGQQNLDLRAIILQILGNTVFMAGLLSFILVYLLRQPNRGFWFDGIVGAGIGMVSWLVLVVVLQNPWPWWTFPAGIAAGAAGFIALRLLLRQIVRLIHIATTLIVIGVLFVIGAGGVLLAQTIITALQSAPAH